MQPRKPLPSGILGLARPNQGIDRRAIGIGDVAEHALGFFDLVLVFYLQILAIERREVLGRAISALALGGTFLFVGHDQTNLADGVGGPRDPDLLYTPDDIVSELPGLEIEKAERVLRDVADADRPAIDALVRAHKTQDP